MEAYHAPRCYILDERYQLILACRPSPKDPLNDLYGADSAADALPSEIDRAVRALTQGWAREGEPAEASAVVRGIRLTVAPLGGREGRHIAVYVAATSSDPPSDYAQSA